MWAVSAGAVVYLGRALGRAAQWEPVCVCRVPERSWDSRAGALAAGIAGRAQLSPPGSEENPAVSLGVCCAALRGCSRVRLFSQPLQC